MMHAPRPRLLAPVCVALAATLAACGPGKPGSTDTTDATTTAGTTATTTDDATSTAPTTTGGAIEKCADARTEAECAMATESDPDTERGCRWGEVLVATFPQAGMCSLDVVGGVCELATFDERGPGCWGFFREAAGGVIELVSFDCGSPASGWESCWNVPMDSPGSEPCACLNPGG